ncbi:Mo-molybdopterin cofactor sulfurase [Zea mays]|uniref:Mo-molybdopterin cofactor sulfurase n=1 Tax=Zea mays TaxID=4577 RepID=A0A1D6EVE5_MAIZE|nr:Mo-molybdopterin cofactor sulfurase [Zea mays]
MPPPPTAVSSCWRGTRRHRAKNLHPHPAAVSVKQPGSGVRFQQFSSLASAAAPALRVLRYQPASTLYESPSSTPPRQLQAMAMEKAASFLSSLLGGGGGEPAATVKSIFIYPIKSCRGLAVSQAPITSTGFRWDRQWVVVNAKGRAYTQRVEPKLALVQVELPPEAFAENWQPTPDDHLVLVSRSKRARYSSLNPPQAGIGALPDPRMPGDPPQFSVPLTTSGAAAATSTSPTVPVSQDSMAFQPVAGPGFREWRTLKDTMFIHSSQNRAVIRAPGMDTLKIPLITEHTTIDDVSVWEWSGSAYDEGAEASEWFSTYFGKPSRLVRFKEGSDIYISLGIASETRPTDPDYAQGYKIMFTDCFPFLIASQGSLDALNEILKEPVPMNRFRPNCLLLVSFLLIKLVLFDSILVDGCHPYSEDLWKTIKINNLTFLGVKLCNRCKVPTINQEDGVPGTEPTETLQTFRSDQVLRPSHKNKRQVYFGQNLVCKESLSGEGKVIKVGDPVYVVQAFASSNEAPA